MSSDPLYSDSKELEKALRDLHPAPLDANFLSRLEAAADEELTVLSASEIQFEKSLRQRAPHALSDDFMQRLEGIVADIQFAKDDKILLFPKTAPAVSKPASRSRYSTWAAAAAVALIGASTALLMPTQKQAPVGLVKNSLPQISQPAPANNSNFVQAGFNSGLGGAVDEGINWQQGNKPHRVLRVEWLDKTTLKDANGKTIEVEEPRTEYIIVPEKID
jgi:hypothetical protein